MTDAIDRVTEAINEDRLVQHLRALVDIPSPTGSEQEIGEHLLAFYSSLGIEGRAQEVEEGRLNAVGILRGSGGGPSLMLNGHMDTSLTGTDEHDRSVLGEVHDGFRPSSWVDQGYVRGLGAFNMKGALAAFMGAIEVIVESDIELRGDVVIAGVAGEIEKTPIDGLIKNYEGSLYRGAGCGTRYLATHGIWTDYAIVGEPSAFHINLAHPGYAWFKLTTRGRFTRTTAIARGINAIKQMTHVIEAVDEWGKGYTARKAKEWQQRVDSHPYSVVKPNVNIGAIEAGWPYKPTWSTAICNLFIDIRTLPGDSPLEVQRELLGALTELKASIPDIDVSVSMYMSNPGGQIANRDSFIVHAAGRAVERVLGSKPGRVPDEFASYWCDMNILNRMGIEAITLGGGHERMAEWDGLGEYFAVEDLVNAARVYAAAIVEVCNSDRDEVASIRQSP